MLHLAAGILDIQNKLHHDLQDSNQSLLTCGESCDEQTCVSTIKCDSQDPAKDVHDVAHFDTQNEPTATPRNVEDADTIAGKTPIFVNVVEEEEAVTLAQLREMEIDLENQGVQERLGRSSPSTPTPQEEDMEAYTGDSLISESLLKPQLSSGTRSDSVLTDSGMSEMTNTESDYSDSLEQDDDDAKTCSDGAQAKESHASPSPEDQGEGDDVKKFGDCNGHTDASWFDHDTSDFFIADNLTRESDIVEFDPNSEDFKNWDDVRSFFESLIESQNNELDKMASFNYDPDAQDSYTPCRGMSSDEVGVKKPRLSLTAFEGSEDCLLDTENLVGPFSPPTAGKRFLMHGSPSFSEPDGSKVINYNFVMHDESWGYSSHEPYFDVLTGERILSTIYEFEVSSDEDTESVKVVDSWCVVDEAHSERRHEGGDFADKEKVKEVSGDERNRFGKETIQNEEPPLQNEAVGGVNSSPAANAQSGDCGAPESISLLSCRHNTQATAAQTLLCEETCDAVLSPCGDGRKCVDRLPDRGETDTTIMEGDRRECVSATGQELAANNSTESRSHKSQNGDEENDNLLTVNPEATSIPHHEASHPITPSPPTHDDLQGLPDVCVVSVAEHDTIVDKERVPSATYNSDVSSLMEGGRGNEDSSVGRADVSHEGGVREAARRGGVEGSGLQEKGGDADEGEIYHTRSTDTADVGVIMNNEEIEVIAARGRKFSADEGIIMDNDEKETDNDKENKHNGDVREMIDNDEKETDKGGKHNADVGGMLSNSETEMHIVMVDLSTTTSDKARNAPVPDVTPEPLVTLTSDPPQPAQQQQPEQQQQQQQPTQNQHEASLRDLISLSLEPAHRGGTADLSQPTKPDYLSHDSDEIDACPAALSTGADGVGQEVPYGEPDGERKEHRISHVSERARCISSPCEVSGDVSLSAVLATHVHSADTTTKHLSSTQDEDELRGENDNSSSDGEARPTQMPFTLLSPSYYSDAQDPRGDAAPPPSPDMFAVEHCDPVTDEQTPSALCGDTGVQSSRDEPHITNEHVDTTSKSSNCRDCEPPARPHRRTQNLRMQEPRVLDGAGGRVSPPHTSQEADEGWRESTEEPTCASHAWESHQGDGRRDVHCLLSDSQGHSQEPQKIHPPERDGKEIVREKKGREEEEEKEEEEEEEDKHEDSSFSLGLKEEEVKTEEKKELKKEEEMEEGNEKREDFMQIAQELGKSTPIHEPENTTTATVTEAIIPGDDAKNLNAEDNILGQPSEADVSSDQRGRPEKQIYDHPSDNYSSRPDAATTITSSTASKNSISDSNNNSDSSLKNDNSITTSPSPIKPKRRISRELRKQKSSRTLEDGEVRKRSETVPLAQPPTRPVRRKQNVTARHGETTDHPPNTNADTRTKEEKRGEGEKSSDGRLGISDIDAGIKPRKEVKAEEGEPGEESKVDNVSRLTKSVAVEENRAVEGELEENKVDSVSKLANTDKKNQSSDRSEANDAEKEERERRDEGGEGQWDSHSRLEIHDEMISLDGGYRLEAADTAVESEPRSDSGSGRVGEEPEEEEKDKEGEEEADSGSEGALVSTKIRPRALPDLNGNDAASSHDTGLRGQPGRESEPVLINKENQVGDIMDTVTKHVCGKDAELISCCVENKTKAAQERNMNEKECLRTADETSFNDLMVDRSSAGGDVTLPEGLETCRERSGGESSLHLTASSENNCKNEQLRRSSITREETEANTTASLQTGAAEEHVPPPRRRRKVSITQSLNQEDAATLNSDASQSQTQPVAPTRRKKRFSSLPRPAKTKAAPRDVSPSHSASALPMEPTAEHHSRSIQASHVSSPKASAAESPEFLPLPQPECEASAMETNDDKAVEAASQRARRLSEGSTHEERKRTSIKRTLKRTGSLREKIYTKIHKKTEKTPREQKEPGLKMKYFSRIFSRHQKQYDMSCASNYPSEIPTPAPPPKHLSSESAETFASLISSYFTEDHSQSPTDGETKSRYSTLDHRDNMASLHGTYKKQRISPDTTPHRQENHVATKDDMEMVALLRESIHAVTETPPLLDEGNTNEGFVSDEKDVNVEDSPPPDSNQDDDTSSFHTAIDLEESLSPTNPPAPPDDRESATENAPPPWPLQDDAEDSKQLSEATTWEASEATVDSNKDETECTEMTAVDSDEVNDSEDAHPPPQDHDCSSHSSGGNDSVRILPPPRPHSPPPPPPPHSPAPPPYSPPHSPSLNYPSYPLYNSSSLSSPLSTPPPSPPPAHFPITATEEEEQEEALREAAYAWERPSISLQTWAERQGVKTLTLPPLHLRDSWGLAAPDFLDSDNSSFSFERDTPSPGPPVEADKEGRHQLNTHHKQQQQQQKEEDRTQKDRCVEVYPETVRQRQRNMMATSNKVDIKNWTSSNHNSHNNNNNQTSPGKPKKFLPSVKALRSQFEAGKTANGKAETNGKAEANGNGVTTNGTINGQTLSRKSSSSSLASNSQDKSSSTTSLHSPSASIENLATPPPGDVPGMEKDNEPVEPIYNQFRKVDQELKELMSKPPSTTGWDPRPFLKRLYYIPEAPKLQSQGTTYVNIEGYLEKLPSGRKKATFWNAWKRRYFMAKDGVLYYYQSTQTEKPSMKMTLMGGKVECMEPNMVGVDDGKGHYVVVRCSSRQEAERWRRALETHTVEDFASQYVQPWPVPTNPTLLRDTLIVDIGSASVRAGVLASQATLPQVFMPSVVASGREGRGQVWGMDALAPDVRANSTLTFPIRPTHKISKYSVDLSSVSSLLQKTFADLKVDPKSYHVQLSVPRILNTNTQAELLRLLFDKFGVRSANLTHQSILALYAYNATSGIVVDVGERMDIVPVIDGYIVDGGVSRVPYGGYRILDHLRQFLYMRNISLINEVESYIIRHVLENICYCAHHYNTEKARCTNKPDSFEKSVSLAEYFNTKDSSYESIALDFGRFQATEGLFNPDAWGLDHPGLHKLVHKAIMECSMDIRKEMSRSIFLAGGVTQLPGLVDRLTTELDNLTPPAIRPKVHASPYRYHAAYIGACVLAESPAFTQSRITREDWNKHGNAALRKWSL